MSQKERDSLMRCTMVDLQNRLALADAIIQDGIKEQAGASAIREVIRQREVIMRAIKDKRGFDRKPKPQGIVIGLKPLALFARR